MQPGAAQYTRTAVALHWIVAFAVFANVLLGLWMQYLPKGAEGARAGWFNLHKSIGLTIAMLVIVRLAWRARHAPPAWPVRAAWEAQAARSVHALLYVCLLVQPMSGLLGSLFTRYPIKYFGVALPYWNRDWPFGKDLMSALHLAGACLLGALVAVHVGATVWHAMRGDGVLHRMAWPSGERS